MPKGGALRPFSVTYKINVLFLEDEIGYRSILLGEVDCIVLQEMLNAGIAGAGKASDLTYSPCLKAGDSSIFNTARLL